MVSKGLHQQWNLRKLPLPQADRKEFVTLLVEKNDRVKNKIFQVGFLPECRFKFAGSPGQDELSLDD